MNTHDGVLVPEPTCFPVAEEIGLLGVAANLSAEEQNAAIKRVQHLLADVYHKEVAALGILATASAREGRQAEVEIKTAAYHLAVSTDARQPEAIHESSSTSDLHNNSDSIQELTPPFYQAEPKRPLDSSVLAYPRSDDAYSAPAIAGSAPAPATRIQQYYNRAQPRPDAFLGAPRSIRANTPHHSARGQVQSEVPAALRGVVTAAIDQALKQTGVKRDAFTAKPTLIGCVPLTQIVIKALYRAKDIPIEVVLPSRYLIRSSRDEFRVPASGIKPGPGWAQVPDLQMIARALRAAGNGSTAMVFTRKSSGEGHAFAATITRQGVFWIDLQAREPISANAPLLLATQTHAVIVDPQGQIAEDALHSWPPHPHTTIEALLDPSQIPNEYGAIGIEVEDLHPLGGKESTDLEYGMILARNDRTGFQLVVDHAQFYGLRDNRIFGSREEAVRAAAGREVPKELKLPIPEVVSSPLKVLKKESSRLPSREGLQEFLRIRESLRRTDREGHPIPLRDLFLEREGWTVFTFENLLVYPSPEGPHHAAYTQFTVGVPIGGASHLLALIQAQIGIPLLEKAVAGARHFAGDLTARYASQYLKSPVRPMQLPYLSGVAGIDELYGYAWLMFSHVSATPFQSRLHLWGMLKKNLLPAALRNPFHVVRNSLSQDIRNFLDNHDNERFIITKFEEHLRQGIADYRKGTPGPDDTRSILDEFVTSGLTNRDFLIATIRGATPQKRTVSQSETVGMQDNPVYKELDRDSGHTLPLALLEIRNYSNSPRMDDRTVQIMFAQLADAAEHAYHMAKRFQGGRPGLSPTAASAILAHPLVQTAATLVPLLGAVELPGDGAPRLLLSRPEYQSVADAIARHILGERLPEWIPRRFDSARFTLLQALASPTQNNQPRLKMTLDYLEKVQRLLQQHATSSTPMASVHVATRIPPIPSSTSALQPPQSFTTRLPVRNAPQARYRYIGRANTDDSSASGLLALLREALDRSSPIAHSARLIEYLDTYAPVLSESQRQEYARLKAQILKAPDGIQNSADKPRASDAESGYMRTAAVPESVGSGAAEELKKRATTALERDEDVDAPLESAGGMEAGTREGKEEELHDAGQKALTLLQQFSAPGTRPLTVAMADTSDPMRAGLQRALEQARAATPPDLDLIARLETQLATWSVREGVTVSVRGQVGRGPAAFLDAQPPEAADKVFRRTAGEFATGAVGEVTAQPGTPSLAASLAREDAAASVHMTPAELQAVEKAKENWAAASESATPYTGHPERVEAVAKEVMQRLRLGLPPVPFFLPDSDTARPGGLQFGIEIEFGKAGNDKDWEEQAIGLATKLQKSGLMQEARLDAHHLSHQNGYTTARDDWRLERETVEWAQAELISPIMSDGRRHWQDIDRVLQVVKNSGWQAHSPKDGWPHDGSTGGHIHVSTGHYGSSTNAYIALLTLVYLFEDVLYRLGSSWRTGGHRGVSMAWPARTAGGLPTEEDLQALVRERTNFVYAVNLGGVKGSASDHVEFRWWDGSLDPAEWQVRVRLSQALVQAAFRLSQEEDLLAELGLEYFELLGTNAGFAGQEILYKGSYEGSEANVYHDSHEALDGLLRLLDVLFTDDREKDQVLALFVLNSWAFDNAVWQVPSDDERFAWIASHLDPNGNPITKLAMVQRQQGLSLRTFPATAPPITRHIESSPFHVYLETSYEGQRQEPWVASANLGEWLPLTPERFVALIAENGYESGRELYLIGFAVQYDAGFLQWIAETGEILNTRVISYADAHRLPADTASLLPRFELFTYPDTGVQIDNSGIDIPVSLLSYTPQHLTNSAPARMGDLVTASLHLDELAALAATARHAMEAYLRASDPHTARTSQDNSSQAPQTDENIDRAKADLAEFGITPDEATRWRNDHLADDIVNEVRKEIASLSGDRRNPSFDDKAIKTAAREVLTARRFVNRRALAQATTLLLLTGQSAGVFAAGLPRDPATHPTDRYPQRTHHEPAGTDRQEGSSRPPSTHTTRAALSSEDQQLADTVAYIQQRGVRPPVTIGNRTTDGQRALEQLVTKVSNALHNHARPDHTAADTAITRYLQATPHHRPKTAARPWPIPTTLQEPARPQPQDLRPTPAPSHANRASAEQVPVPGRWSATDTMFVLDPDLLSPTSSLLAEQVTEVGRILANGNRTEQTSQEAVPRVGFATTSHEEAAQSLPRAMAFADDLAKHLGSVRVMLPNGHTITVCEKV
ncbi:toxin glutamine deamidase domain-containing protein [Streptomyces sp. NBC_01455]|uniref:toxin glutamine deamidase domain-containing protein n=1 Tax=Streptomyces sp. NBC_01455 TaxID=2903874 RepID=UPI002E314782|nr:toxin glutamine deamidase domain-containing protein [Streptomyces sp. NBC_01455]